MQLLIREKLRNVRCLVNSVAPGLASALAALVMVGAAAALLGWPAQAGAQQDVVATVGSHPITAKELNEKIAPQIDQARNEAIKALANGYLLERGVREKLTVAEYLKELGAKIQTQAGAARNEIYQIKRNAIRTMADDYLLEQAAQREKLTPDEYLKRHLANHKVTEADAKKYYDEHKAQIHRPYEQIQKPLIQFLERQQERNQSEQLLAGLRQGHVLKVLLEEPRSKIKTDGHPEIGSKNAPVTMIEFADFQCPFCKRAEPTLQALRKKYGDKLRLVYFDFPLPMHQHALEAAEAARCAGEQDKFWPYHDKLFADQSKLAPAELKATAAQLGLDTAKFDRCLAQNKYDNAVHRDMAEGDKLGVTGTPAFFINGRLLGGAQPQSEFESVIDEELAAGEKKPTQTN